MSKDVFHFKILIKSVGRIVRGKGVGLIYFRKVDNIILEKIIIMIPLFKNFKLSSLGMVFFIIPLISHQKISASSFWTCENEDGFISVFKINTNPTSVTHISSYNSKNGDEWSVNQPLQVVFSNSNIISTIDVYIEDEAIYHDIFNLKRKSFISREVFFDGSEGITQNYRCE